MHTTSFHPKMLLLLSPSISTLFHFSHSLNCSFSNRMNRLYRVSHFSPPQPFFCTFHHAHIGSIRGSNCSKLFHFSSLARLFFVYISSSCSNCWHRLPAWRLSKSASLSYWEWQSKLPSQQKPNVILSLASVSPEEVWPSFYDLFTHSHNRKVPCDLLQNNTRTE